MKIKHIRLFYTLFLTLLLTSCGGADSGIDLPAERPSGFIIGTVLNGSFKNAEVNIYTMENLNNRHRLTKTNIDRNGRFSAEIKSPDQAIIIEVSGGSYTEPETGIEVFLREGQVLSAPLYYKSATNYQLSITPLSHMATAILVKRAEKGSILEEQVNSAYSKLSTLFKFNIQKTRPYQATQEPISSIAFSGKYLYYLWLYAISKKSEELSFQSEQSLNEQINSISISQIMYADMLADEKLDGIGKRLTDKSIVPLELAKQKIGPDFYRSELAMSFQQSAAFKQLVLPENFTAFRQYIHEIAHSQNNIFFSDKSHSDFHDSLPNIQLLSQPATFYNETVYFDFAVGGERPVQSVSIYFDNQLMSTIGASELPTLEIDSTLLNDGKHQLLISAIDTEDNYVERNFEIGIDNTPPDISILSTLTSNKKSYRLFGKYSNSGASLQSIKIDSNEAVIEDNNWFVDLQLLAGSNIITLNVVDDLQNRELIQIEVIVDLNAPIFESNFQHSKADFVTDDNTIINERLTDIDLSKKLLIEIDKLSLNGMAEKQSLLDKNNIPYFKFSIRDPTLEGVATPLSDIAVQMQVRRNSTLLADKIPLLPEENTFIIPLTQEKLGLDWPNSLPDDIITISLSASDSAENITEKEFQFKTVFLVPKLDLPIIEEPDNSLLKNISFSKRATLYENFVTVATYQLVNTTGRSFFIKLQDEGTHEIQQTFEKLQRTNLVSLVTIEEWQVAKFSDPRIDCPKITGQWTQINSLWNYTFVNSWVQEFPAISESDPEFVFSDAPIAPGASDWIEKDDFDNEYKLFEQSEFGEIISYEYDYIPNLNIAGAAQPAAIRNWNKNSITDIPPCDQLTHLQTRNTFSFTQQPDYPKNIVSQIEENNNITDVRFKIFNSGNQAVLPIDGWYSVKALERINIVKEIKSGNIAVYNASVLLTPTLETEYTPQFYDKEILLKADRSLNIQYKFNPLQISMKKTAERTLLYNHSLLIKRITR